MTMYQVKDFVETAQGLLFAVVDSVTESGRVLVYLRYQRHGLYWQKLSTEQAYQYLQSQQPDYLWHSTRLDADLQAVPQADIVRHYRPRAGLASLLAQPPMDNIIVDLQHLCSLLQQKGISMDSLGITGSCLLGLQQNSSDLDLVCYERRVFQALRQAVEQLIIENHCHALNDSDWLDAYQRRGCQDLTLDDYIWHERRKFNKAMIHQRKFDISLVTPPTDPGRYFSKLGRVKLQAHVTDASAAFDYPARFSIDHPDIRDIVCFTATYNGQAQTGELIVAAGQLEADATGRQRLVIGSNREALGEYLRVLHV